MTGSILCTWADYRLFTGDNVNPESTVDPLLAEAEQIIAEKLNRVGISDGVYTERLRIFYDPAATGLFGPSGWVYPSAVPITSVVTPDGTTILSDGVTIRDVSPDADPIGLFGSPIQLDRYCTVTYEGGWTAGNVPRRVARAIARVARNLQAPFAPGQGALLNASQGDTRVTYAAAGTATADIDTETWKSIRGWKYQLVS